MKAAFILVLFAFTVSVACHAKRLEPNATREKMGGNAVRVAYDEGKSGKEALTMKEIDDSKANKTSNMKKVAILEKDQTQQPSNRASSDHETRTKVVNDGKKKIVALKNDLNSESSKGKQSSSKENLNKKNSIAGPKGRVNRVLIGKQDFSPEKVTSIGDIDGNGFDDFIVASPKENSNCGAVRLYLMNKNDQVKLERHVVPGKWGFFHRPLSEGDMFGSSVLPIGDVNKDGVDDVAIGAPGDKESGTAKGAVYILLMKHDGSVRHTKKLSAASDLSLGSQLKPGEGFGANLTRISDINGDEIPEVSVGSLDGSSTLVFLSEEGDAHASVKFHGKSSVQDLLAVVQHSNVVDGIAVKKYLNFVARAPSDTCYFTDTHCQCETTGKSTARCLNAVETLKDGRTKCEERDCRPSFKCSCGGDRLCTRSSVKKEIFKAHESAGGKLFYCSNAQVQNEEVKVIPGASVSDFESSSERQDIGVWSDTMCACSPASSLGKGPGTCVDFDHNIAGGKALCNVRQCEESNEMLCDITGKSVCSREYVSKEKYTDDGEAGGFHTCHLEKEEVEVTKCEEKCPA